MENRLGIGFNPNNDLICLLLHKKRLDPHFSHHAIWDIDHICSHEPWELARESDIESEDQVWYFFYKPYYKYKESNRAHRRTNAGYWKVTSTDSKIMAKNGLTGSRKILTFYLHGPASKKTKTQWVMREFHVKDNPSYETEFVLCRIERKWKKKHGISMPDEGESSQQLVSPTQQLISDHLISSGNYIDEKTVINPQQQLPCPYLISQPQTHIQQTTLTNNQLPLINTLIPYSESHFGPNTWTNPQLLPDSDLILYLTNHFKQNIVTNPPLLLPNYDRISCSGIHIEPNTLINPQIQSDPNLISYPGYHIGQNSVTNPQILPDPNLIPYPGYHIGQNSVTNPQTQSDPDFISYPGYHIGQNSMTNPLILPDPNLIPYPGYHIGQNSVTNPQLLLPNHNRISCSGIHIEPNALRNPQILQDPNLIPYPGYHNGQNSVTNSQLLPSNQQPLPYQNLGTQLLQNQPLAMFSVAENTFQEEHLQHGEFNAWGAYNGLNSPSFSAPLSPIYPELEFSYSNSSINNFGYLNSQINNEQVNDLINCTGLARMEETGQTLPPNFDSSKSDGGTYAEDSSDTNTETFHAWVNEYCSSSICNNN